MRRRSRARKADHVGPGSADIRISERSRGRNRETKRKEKKKKWEDFEISGGGGDPPDTEGGRPRRSSTGHVSEARRSTGFIP